MLIEMAKGIREEMNAVFRFNFLDTESRIYSLQEPNVQNLYLTLLKVRGADEENARERLRKCLCGELSQECHYTGDIVKIKDRPVDYVVFVPTIDDKTPFSLGEEITHGEHETEHVREIGNYDEFCHRFSPPAQEFLGMLGKSVVARNRGARIVLDGLKVSNGDATQSDLNHHIGYDIALQLDRSGKEIPYSDLFHAPDQAHVWGIVSEIITPRISLPVRERGLNDALYERARRTLKGCGLDSRGVTLEE